MLDSPGSTRAGGMLSGGSFLGLNNKSNHIHSLDLFLVAWRQTLTHGGDIVTAVNIEAAEELLVVDRKM